MSGKVSLTMDGQTMEVPDGTSVAVALHASGRKAFRRSVTGMLRGPVCGMGVCYECCLTVDGHPHVRSCMTLCREGMEVVTG